MRTKFYVWCMALFTLLGATACSDDDHPAHVSDKVKDTFAKDYPNAGRVEWSVKAGYNVADFYQDGVEMDVWYDKNAQWCMTETDLRRDLAQLPTAVQNAYQSSEYSSWTIDDIDKYECPDKVFYLIEIETKGKKDRNLFYSDSGQLLRDVEDKENDDVLPTISF